MIYNGGLIPLNNSFLLYVQYNSSLINCFQIDVSGRILNQYAVGEAIVAKSGNKALIASINTAWVIDNLLSYLKTGIKSIVGSVAIVSRGIDAAANLQYIATREKYSEDFIQTLTDISPQVVLSYSWIEKLIGEDGSLLFRPQSSPWKWKISTDKGVNYTEVFEAVDNDVFGTIYNSSSYLFLIFPTRQIDFYGPLGLRSKTLWGDEVYAAGWIDATRCAFAVGSSGVFRVYIFDYNADSITLIHSTTDYFGYTNQRISYSNGYLFVTNGHMIEVINLVSGPMAQINLSTILGGTSDASMLYVADFFN